MNAFYTTVLTHLLGKTIDSQPQNKQGLSAEWVIIPTLLLIFSAGEWLQAFNPVGASPLVVSSMAAAAIACSLYKYWISRREHEAI